MLKILTLAVFAVILAVASQSNQVLAQISGMKFKDLPADVRNHANEIRGRCKELGWGGKLHSRMQGIAITDLDGDGSRGLIVENEKLCDGYFPGANCSNAGCDLLIWKQVDRRSWKKIFDHQLSKIFISLGGENRRFQLMVVSIYAGSPQCKPVPGKSYFKGETCDALVRYQKGKMVWEKIEPDGAAADAGKEDSSSDLKKCVGQYDWDGGSTRFENQPGGFAGYTNCTAPEDSLIAMNCVAGQEGVNVTLVYDSGVRDTQRVKIHFQIGKQGFTRNGTASWNEMAGISQPVLKLKKSDPLLNAMANGRNANIRSGRKGIQIPLIRAGNAIKAMLHACGE